jgi:uncharacterized protein YjbI with pentapeptide repeats
MRSFAKVFCLSVLSVALLAGSAQARTVKGCVIKAKTSCAGKNLSGQNLRGVNLSSANMNGVNLSKADLRGADLKGAKLRKANLKGAKLGPKPTTKKNGARTSATPSCNPNCSGANLTYADLSYADLSYATVYKADLTSANLTSANLTYVIMTGTYFSTRSVKTECSHSHQQTRVSHSQPVPRTSTNPQHPCRRSGFYSRYKS